MSALPALAICAGGLSTRMGGGVDKAALVIDGQSVLERLARCAEALSLEVLIIGRPQPAGWAGPPATFLDDLLPGQGPLGALHTALHHRPVVLACACDMPGIGSQALSWLIACARQPYGDALVVSTADGLEPLFAIYSAHCLPAIARQLAGHQRALHRLVPLVAARLIEAPPWLIPQLANCNTPEEWARQAGVR